MYELFRLLKRTGPWLMLLATVGGMLDGSASGYLMHLINYKLHSRGNVGLVQFGFAILMVTGGTLLVRASLVILSARLAYEQTRRIIDIVLRSPLRNIESITSPRILNVVIGDVPTFANAAGTNLSSVVSNSMIVVGTLGYLAWLAPLTSLVAFGILGGAALVQVKLRSRLRALFRETRAISDRSTLHIEAALHGIKELKLNRDRRAAFSNDLVIPTLGDLKRSSIRNSYVGTSSQIFGRVSLLVLIGLLLCGPRSMTGFSSGALATGYILAVLYMMTPFRVIDNMIVPLMGGVAALDRIRQLEADHTKIQEPAAEIPAARASVQLELKGITYTYFKEEADETFALGPIDLSIPPGKLTFLVGPNGSGKSSLAKLICGLYEPLGGQIHLNGEPISEQNRDWYRNHFSAIFSDFYLFEQLLGAGSEADDRATGYIRRLHLHHKVSVRDGKLSTTKLSQGQRKRLALVVAYLEDRPVLVFDEWAADQDPAFRQVFYDILLPELAKRGKTVLVVTHDDRYFSRADRIIRLESGQVVECRDQIAS